MYCSACGTQNEENNYRCIQCGQILPRAQQPQHQQQAHGQMQAGGYAQQPQTWGPGVMQPYGQPGGGGDYPMVQKSRTAAALLQILVPMGIGRFYLGYTGIGIAQLALTLLTCGVASLWPFIDGILMLTGSPSTDANGVPLKQ